MPSTRPNATEIPEYYFTYINQVPDGDIRRYLETQAEETARLFRGISDERSHHRYADGKWSIREVLSHINDCERLFAFRAFWFARGLEGNLPSFDQEVAIRQAGAGDRPWQSHLDEFDQIRASTISLFRHLPADAWDRRGTASGYEFTARSLAWTAAGHVTHHVRLMHERYL